MSSIRIERNCAFSIVSVAGTQSAAPPVAIVKKQQQQHQPIGNTLISDGAQIKEHILSSPKTPIRAAQAVASPISYGVGTAQSILSPNSVASSINNQQGQQIIITTSAPIPTLVSTTIVSFVWACPFSLHISKGYLLK